MRSFSHSQSSRERKMLACLINVLPLASCPVHAALRQTNFSFCLVCVPKHSTPWRLIPALDMYLYRYATLFQFRRTTEATAVPQTRGCDPVAIPDDDLWVPPQPPTVSVFSGASRDNGMIRQAGHSECGYGQRFGASRDNGMIRQAGHSECPAREVGANPGV